MDQDRVRFLLRFGDNTLVLSQRLGQWCGKGPALEEDMALTNVALDLLGQARLWLSYAAELQGEGADEDSLAFHRDASAFYNLLLVEQPNGTYADTLMRQLLFDAWHALALRELGASTDQRVADIAQKATKEVAYHLRRSSDLVVRLGDGSERSHAMMQDALDNLWRFTGEMFEADAIDAAMMSARVGFTSTWTRRATPDPLSVSPMIQRAVSPAAIGPASVRLSPGSRAMVVICPTAA